MKNLKKILCLVLCVALTALSPAFSLSGAVFGSPLTAEAPLSSQSGIYTPLSEPQAEGVYVVNEDFGLVMYSKNENKRLYPASLTKIMSALVALENISDLDAVSGTMTTALLSRLYNTGSSNIALTNGETITVRTMLYAMMLRSAGDAALLLAEVVGGTVEAFVEMMNEKAVSLGCSGTNFTSPHGLHDENHYSTPADMYKIAHEAMQNPVFAEIVKSTGYEMPASNKRDKQMIFTTNNMMLSSQTSVYYKPVNGIKTGFTTPAGPCLASIATSNGITYLMIVMKSTMTNTDGSIDSSGAFKVSKELYNWLYNNYELKSAIRSGTPVGEPVKVNYGKESDEVSAVVRDDFITVLPKTAGTDTIRLNYTMPSAIDAPVTEGQPLGSADITIGGKVIGSVELVASNSIKKSNLEYILSQIGGFFSSEIMIAAGAGLLVLIAGYVALNITYNKRKKESRYTKKYKPPKDGSGPGFFR